MSWEERQKKGLEILNGLVEDRIFNYGHYSSKLQSDVEKLSNEDLECLETCIWQFARAARDAEKAYKLERIDRKTNFEKLIKQADKLFTEIDISILEQLSSDDGAWNFSGLRILSNLNEKEVRKSIKKLKGRGLVGVYNGLFNEDGEPVGSGYGIIDRRQEEIEKIIYNYRGIDKKNQESLL